MRRPPRDPKIHVMDGFAIWRVAFVGSMIAVSAFILEAWLQPRGYSPEFIRTVLLQTLVTAQWFYMLNCRVSDGFSLTKGLLANKGIWIVSGVLLVLQLLIIYAPFMQMLFGTRAAVPLLGDHLYHRLRHVPDRGTGKTADPQMAFRLTA